MLLAVAAIVLVLAVVWYFVGRQEPAPTEVKVDATDVSGGELIVTEPTPGEVPVDVPDTPMTNVPPSEGASASPAAE
ncbi:hypothetical protein SZ64_15510 [Erythrobacter sp. SG61-1L]|nr:hypothetical protein SZ64_15510 [Erythrobacter sp. SG61-1L]